MKAISIIIVFVLLFFGLNAFSQEFYPLKTAERMVKRSLKNNDITLSGRIEINKKVGTGEKIVVFKLHHNSFETQKYVVFSHALGRYDLFDYILIVSDTFSIEKVDVIKYRSEHGGEIASKKWLSQFVNYSSGNLKYGNDISAISGATLSATSITNDIQLVIELLKEKMAGS